MSCCCVVVIVWVSSREGMVVCYLGICMGGSKWGWG